MSAEGLDRDRLPARARLALWLSAAIWLLVLITGFLVPAGWRWGLPGLYGHINNFMITLWLVAMVAAPLLASRGVRAGRSAAQVFLLADLAVIAASLPRPITFLNEGLPILLALLTAAALLATHPDRLRLLRP